MPREIYPRDLVGYGPNPPHADWPGGARIAVQIVEPHRCHGDLGRQAYLTHAQRQDAIAPCPNVRRPFNTSTPEAPTDFEEDDCRDGELTGGECDVATSSCRPSEPCHVLGHP